MAAHRGGVDESWRKARSAQPWARAQVAVFIVVVTALALLRLFGRGGVVETEEQQSLAAGAADVPELIANTTVALAANNATVPLQLR